MQGFYFEIDLQPEGMNSLQSSLCVCVCVCVCVRVYVVYEDTNLYNDMGMTEVLQNVRD